MMKNLPVYTAPITDGSGDVAFFDHGKTAVIIVTKWQGTRQIGFNATGLIFKGTTIVREEKADWFDIRTTRAMRSAAIKWVRENADSCPVAQGRTPA